MKIGGIIFALGAAFYAVVTVAYWFITQEPIGTTVLALTGGLAFLIAFYTIYTAKRVGPLPEDNEMSNISDADSDYGFFSPHSWWPLALGFSIFLVSLGLVFAAWLAVLGVLAILYTTFGLLFEYYRGEFAS